MSIVLDSEHHLSFPAIKRLGDEIYIYPENSASGSLVIYKYSIQSNTLSQREVLVNRPLTDAIIFDRGDCEMIFATELPNPNGNVLKVFVAKKNGLMDLLTMPE